MKRLGRKSIWMSNLGESLCIRCLVSFGFILYRDSNRFLSSKKLSRACSHDDLYLR